MALARKVATALARMIVVTLGLGCCAIAILLVVIAWPDVWATVLLGVLAAISFASGAFAVFRGICGPGQDSESTAHDFLWELAFRILFGG